MSGVVVVGAGIVGLSIAWRLVERGLAVTVLDGGKDDAAWYAAAGMLAPGGEIAFGQEPLAELMIESARRWPSFAAELAGKSGLDLGYDTTGALAVALTADDLAVARRDWDYTAALKRSVRPAVASCLREAEPALSPRIRGGAFIPDDHQVDPRKVVAALRLLLENVIEEGRPAVMPEGKVIVAAGLGTAALTGLPVRPVKGLILRLRGEPGLLRHVIDGYVDGRHVYLVPRAGGEIVVGATQEERGDFTVTAGAVLELLRSAIELVPEVAECELVETLVRHRPATPDNAPLLGLLRPDVVVAAGHHRNGVLLAPVTADLIAGLVATGTPDPLLAAFAPGRFA